MLRHTLKFVQKGHLVYLQVSKTNEMQLLRCELMDNSIAQMKGQMKRKIIPSGTTCVQCNFEYAMMPST